MKTFFKQLICRAFLLTVLFTAPVIQVCALADTDSVKVNDVSKRILYALNNVAPVGNTFTEVFSLDGVIFGDMAWGDYDNDNDLDVVVTGNASHPNAPTTVVFAKLFKNTGGVFAEDTNSPLMQLFSGSVAWGDYDNDGDIDLLLTGSDLDDVMKPTTLVYNNTGGVLTARQDVAFPGTYRGSTAWVDHDNDGDLDIFVTGWTHSTPTSVGFGSSMYKNTNGTFEPFQYNPSAAHEGDAVWSDADGDLDFDLLITGGVDNTSLWFSNGDAPFGYSILDGLSASSAVWGDFDNDGDQDLIVSGTKNESNIGTARLYKNTAGTLDYVGNAGLTGHYESSISAGDYDNDGDLDVLMTGFTSPYTSTNTDLYNNDGTGNFTEASSTGLSTPVRSGDAKWGDYDNDGDLDLMVIGSNSGQDTRVIKIYRNDLTAANAAPATPTGLTSSQTASEVTFSWNAATDAQGGKVSYNLRIGTTPGGSEIMSTNSNLATGYHRITGPGNVGGGLSWKVKNLNAAKYYWSVQAIDNSGKAGTFPSEGQTVIQFPAEGFKAEPGNAKVLLSWTNPNTNGHFVIYRETSETSTPANIIAAAVSGTTYTDASVTNSTTYYYYIKAADSNGNASAVTSANATPEFFSEVKSFTYVQYGSSAWGDYDSDGDYDIVYTGFSPTSKFVSFNTNSSGAFTEVPGPALVSGSLTYASWNDYDNDNDLDVLVTGVTEPATLLLKNTSGVFSAAANTELPVLQGQKHSWVDFDNDGDQDLGVSRDSKKYVYQNNKSSFSQAIELPFSYSMEWGDYDNDGDMDCAIGAGTYENVGGVLTKITTLTVDGTVAWADIDNDSDLDLIASSVYFSATNSRKAFVYRNDGSVFTPVEQTGITPLYGADIATASISMGDYDNDGDLDLLMTGSFNNLSNGKSAVVYNNNGTGTFSKDDRILLPQLSSANASWGDYDRDGDLDVIVCGRTLEGSSGLENKVFRNNLNALNTAPTVPSGLQSTVSNSKITFAWDAATDTQGGPITYNLRVGTTPGGSEIMSAMANTATGKLLTPAMGNVQLNRSWTLNGIGGGTYYWSVQAVDGAFAASTFAVEKQIVLSTQTITFEALDGVQANQVPFTLTANASSGLPVTFTSSDLSVATISGNQVTIVSTGTTNITASQPGNNSHAAAVPVVRVLTVNKLSQTITFPAVASKTVGDAPFAVSATASSALAVTFSTTSDKITLTGTTVAILKAGSVTVTASQVGNISFNAATSVPQTFCIHPTKPTIAISGADTENIMLTSSATEGNQWYLNGTALPSATQTTFHPTAAGVYTVKVTVDNCSSELSQQLPLIVTDVMETSESKIRLYPNPTTSHLTVELPSDNNLYTLQLFQSDGSRMLKSETTLKTITWDVHEFPTGLYIVRVQHLGKKEHHKFIKR